MNTLTDYKHHTDLSALIAADLGQEPKRAGKWQTYSCPFPGHAHGDKNRSLVVVNPAGNRAGYWKCYGCGRAGTSIDWLIHYRNMTIKDVAAMLKTAAPLPAAPARPEPVLMASEPIPAWQDRAHAFMSEARAALWTDAAAPARHYLMTERKFTESMLRTWDIGFNPATRYELKTDWGLQPIEGESPKMILRRGVVIPCYETGIVHYIKIRVLPAEQKNDESKYRKLAGSQPGIMGLDTIYHTDTLFATEGELNLLPLWEGLNRLEDAHRYAAISFGSASDYEALLTAAERLLPIKTIIAVYDNDKAGTEARQRLSKITGRIVFANLPESKDIAEYHQATNAVSAWCAYQIERAKNPPRDLGFEK